MTNIFTLEPATEEGIVLQTNHYYPFGMSYATNSQSSIAQPWRFGGKEIMCDASLNLYDFEARLYSPETGRFVQVDPMVEKYYPISPFAIVHQKVLEYFLKQYPIDGQYTEYDESTDLNTLKAW